jgi:hypothetical protein
MIVRWGIDLAEINTRLQLYREPSALTSEFDHRASPQVITPVPPLQLFNDAARVHRKKRNRTLTLRAFFLCCSASTDLLTEKSCSSVDQSVRNSNTGGAFARSTMRAR